MADGNYCNIGEPPQPYAYFSFYQQYRSGFNIHVQGRAPDALIQVVRSVIREMQPALPVYNMMTLRDLVNVRLGQQRISATMVGAFATLAVVLAVVGLYGVLSYLVAHQTREIGIRVALGASAQRVAQSILGRGLLLAGSGIVLGLVVALASARVVSSFLYGVEPRDTVTFTLVPIAFVVVAAMASFLPARRASRIDPMVALREE